MILEMLRRPRRGPSRNFGGTTSRPSEERGRSSHVRRRMFEREADEEETRVARNVLPQRGSQNPFRTLFVT